MSATAAPAITSATVAPARAVIAADARSAPSSEHGFDRRLDAARQQRHDDNAATTAREDTRASAHAKPAHTGPSDDGKAAPAPARTTNTSDPASDAAALAAAMLALLGQAAPMVAAIGAPGAGAGASAGGPRGALAALSATGESKGVDSALGALLEGSAGITSAAAPLAALNASGAAVADLLPAVNPLKDERTTSLQDLAPQMAAMNPPAPDNLVGPSGAHLLSVASPVGTAAFAQDLGQQITWLGTRDLKQARIKLHPADLGPLDIKMSVTHDRVDLTFIAQHPATVHAVQQSLAHLDTMLAQHGMTLGHADVSQQQRGDGNGSNGHPDGHLGEADEVDAFAPSPLSRTTPTLLDTFA